LIAKQPPSPMVATSTPANAGPMTRAALKAAELSAMAFERSSLPTSSTRNDWRTGRSKALMTPNTNASASTIQGRTAPFRTAAASTAAWSSAAPWVR